MCVRRKLTGGHNFEILMGTDLTDEEVQRSVLEYLKLAKPLAVIMAPRCGPFGPLGRFNQAINPDGWLRNYALSAPLASFCGKVALLQRGEGRHFLVEQPRVPHCSKSRLGQKYYPIQKPNVSSFISVE